MAYRIRIANYYSVGGRKELTAKDENGRVLTFLTETSAHHVAREYDPFDYDVYEVKRGQVNANIDSRIDPDIWRKWEAS